MRSVGDLGVGAGDDYRDVFGRSRIALFLFARGGDPSSFGRRALRDAFRFRFGRAVGELRCATRGCECTR